jgi:hypothetical protein
MSTTTTTMTSETGCKCGHTRLQHEQGDNDHLCKSCNCWGFKPSISVRPADLIQIDTAQQSKWNECFEAANKKIEALNCECKKSMKEVVLALASELKTLGFPVNRIANAIVHQSKGRWGSRSWIPEIIPDEYKDKSHQESAKRKQKVPPVQQDNSGQIAPLAERQSGKATTSNPQQERRYSNTFGRTSTYLWSLAS